MERNYKIKIVNIVASAQIGEDIDLNRIDREVKGAVYKQKQFPGLVLRVREPKTATLIFRSGKIICTGSKSVKDVNRAIKQVVNILSDLGISVIQNSEIKVQNIVASADLGVNLNLNAIAIGLGLENVEYEPEQFPALVYRLSNPRVVMLIFGTGRVVITGGKSIDDVMMAVDNVAEELLSLGFIG